MLFRSISQPYRQFSEFNALGFYTEKMESESYVFVDVTGNVNIPENKCHQFWSWSGLNEKDLKQINEMI